MLANLDLIAELAGTWQGSGLNIAARPDFQNQSNVLVGLSLTSDTLSFDPIPSSIHNRGFSQPDIELFGLTYLQHTSDATTGGALHIEPGMWINLPPTIQPAADPPLGGQLVARMWSIPHGASFVAQGFALPFSGPPVISPGADPTSGGNPAFSSFPSFNSTPLLPAFPDQESAIFAAGTSEAQAKAEGGFPEYTFTDPPGITQQVVNDPVVLLQQTIVQQLADGYQFEGVALNISTASAIRFDPQPVVFPDPGSPVNTVSVPQFGGGIANHTFLLGISNQKPNLSTALVYATFWLEKLHHPDGRPPLMQLQYAQTALVNFPARNISGQPNLSWPHITVSTLQRTLN
ncbi:heme-binding protein [Mycobacterium sp.]|uniref:heme-binding protein n=1 Tax=Mycobacterium sp. TaxID=1785 RepID=UPI003D6C55B6